MLWNDVVYVSLLLLSMTFGCFYRTIKEPRDKQWAATIFGYVLVICVSGLSVIHPILIVLINAIIITNLSWKKCHLVSFYFSFFYLLVIFRLSDYLFGLPTPPTHTNLVVMILTLKLSGLAFEINSAAIAPDNDIQGANSDAFKKIGFMDVIHYSFSYMGVLTGPYYRYRTYWDSLHKPFSNYVDPWPLTYYKLKQIAAFITLFLIMNHLFPSDYTQTVEFEELNFFYRFFYIYPTFACFRLRMYSGMVLAECVCQMSGLGAYPVCCQPVPGLGPRDYKTVEKIHFHHWLKTFSSFSDRDLREVRRCIEQKICIYYSDENICNIKNFLRLADIIVIDKSFAYKGVYVKKSFHHHEKAKMELLNFETVHNMKIWEVEFSPLVRHTMKIWNTCIQYWMAVCIYKRFPYKSLRTVVTLTLSALWHGYAAGYYFCICQVPLYLLFEDICVKFYNQYEENGIAKKAWRFFLWWAKLTCMAYLGVPFLLLRFQEIIHFYKSLYFSGHILGLGFYLTARILKPYLLKRRQTDEEHKNK